MRTSTVLLAVLLFAGQARAQAKLQITSPANGTVVHPGAKVKVSVEASGGSVRNLVLAGELTGLILPSGPGYQFSVLVPAKTQVGRHDVTAIGFTGPGKWVYSSPLTLDVEPAQAFMKLLGDTSGFELDVGDQIGLQLLGEYADGSKLDLSRSTHVPEAPAS